MKVHHIYCTHKLEFHLFEHLGHEKVSKSLWKRWNRQDVIKSGPHWDDVTSSDFWWILIFRYHYIIGRQFMYKCNRDFPSPTWIHQFNISVKMAITGTYRKAMIFAVHVCYPWIVPWRVISQFQHCPTVHMLEIFTQKLTDMLKTSARAVKQAKQPS